MTENSDTSNPYTVPNPSAASESRLALPADGRRNLGCIALALGFLALLFCAGLLVPAIRYANPGQEKYTQINRVAQIGLGIHNYHAAYNQLPFTKLTNSQGLETVGWRVAISPFVEGQEQWFAIDTSEPWDGIHNKAVIQNPPDAFRSLDSESGQTSLFAIVSDESMFPPAANTKMRFRDVLDGLSNTVMAIELPNRSTPWSSTTDITPAEAYQAIEEMDDSEVALLLMADGAVTSISYSFDRETFDALVTRSGQELIPDDF